MAIHRPLSSSLWMFVLLTSPGIRFTRSSPDPELPRRSSDVSGASSSADKSTLELTAVATSLAPSADGNTPRSSLPAFNVPGTSSDDCTLMPSMTAEDVLLSVGNVSPSSPTSDVPGSSAEVSEYSSSLLSGMTTFPSIKFEDGKIYRLELEEPLPDDPLLTIMREKIHETPENAERAKNELVELLRNNKELHVPWHNAAWLTRFLRARKYNVKKTLELIKRYYEFKENNKSIYNYDLASDAVLGALQQEVIVILPGRTRHGSRLIIGRANKWKHGEYPFDKMCTMAVMLVELGMYEPKTQLAGAQAILDLKDVTWAQAGAIVEYIFLAAKMVDWIQNCIPFRLVGIHVVNEPKWFWRAYRIVQHVLTKEIKDSLEVHGTNWTALREVIGDDNLPKVYGGKITVDYAIPVHLWKNLLEYEEREHAEIRSYGIRREKSSSTWGKMLRWKTKSTTGS